MRKLLLYALLSSASLFAAGSVQQSLNQLGATNTWVLSYQWTGDASTGTVPITAASLAGCSCQGYLFTQVEVVPLSPAPTAGYAVAILDAGGADVLDGAAASLSATTPQAFAAAASATPLQGTFRLSLTGQSVAGAKGTVFVFLSKPGTVNLATLGRGGGATSTANWLTLANPPFVDARIYNWTPQTPGGSIAAGANTVTLSPMPSNLLVGDNLYLATAGTPESAPITAISGAQVTFTAANSHGAGYTVGPVAFGIQESINKSCANGGGSVLLQATTYTMHGTVFVPCGGVWLLGQGKSTTTLYRTEDYGDTFQVGAAAIGSILDVQFRDLTMTYDMGSTFNGSGQITAIARHPTAFPNSAHIRGYGLIYFRLIRCRLNDMPYNLISDGGAYSSVEDSQFQGLWDYTSAALQVTKASLYLTGDITPHGSTQGFYITDSDFFGFNSPARNVTINGVVLNFSENIGPEYMIQADYVEVMQYKGGLNGGGGVGVYLNPATNGLSGITITGVHFDGNRVASGMLIDNLNSGTGNVINVEFTGNDCQGSGNSNSCILVNSSTGIRPVSAMSITGNMFSTFNGSAISLLDGTQISIGGGQTFRNFNFRGAYNASNQTVGGSGVNVGGNASLVGIAGGNVYCGGTNDIYGVTVDNSEKITILPGRNAGVCVGAAPDLAFLGVLPGPIFSVGGWNYIAAETGGSANNAIAANITGFNGLVDGTCIYLNLAHSLQAGGNTIALNGGAAVSLKSHLNTANDIAAAYTSGAAFLHACYKSSSNLFLDMSQ